MRAYVLITVSPGRATKVARSLQGQEGILAADAISGEYDVIAVCEASDHIAMGHLVMDKIQKIDGVFKTITCLVMM